MICYQYGETSAQKFVCYFDWRKEGCGMEQQYIQNTSMATVYHVHYTKLDWDVSLREEDRNKGITCIHINNINVAS